jgi:hypothetical protein
MRIQHQLAIDDKFCIEVSSSVPLARANPVVAGMVVNVKVCVVAFPYLAKSVVNVLEKFLCTISTEYLSCSQMLG